MNLRPKILAFSALGVFLALPAAADVVNVYQIGASSNICGPHTARDPSRACINGSAAPTWVNTFSGNPGDQATLTILAEGIDNGSATRNPSEFDRVLVNGVFVGDLTQQSFYSPIFNLSNSNAGTGPLDLDGDSGDSCVTGQPCSAQVTDLSVSTFDVTGLVVPGANTIRVVVDPSNWDNEIDTSSLTARATAPEPGTLSLLGTGVFLVGLASFRRRRQNASSTY
jgi:hypothetical protein